MPSQDTPGLLRALTEAGIDYVLIGGVAALAHGASTFTRDVDVVISFDPSTLGTLVTALAGLSPRFALDPAHRPLPDAAALVGYGNLYLDTSLGRIDILGETAVGPLRALLERAVALDLGGFVVHVASLDDLIAMKSALGRPKDKLVEVELRAIRARLARGQEP